ncbi:hypothetical protein KR054_006185, partial [Drosophila jambulina]
KLANKKWRKEETSENHSCNVCCADLDLSSAKNYVTCRTCGKSVCRGLKCADWRPKDASWECQLCQSSKESLAHTSSWVAEQMSFNQHKFVYPMRARSEVYIPIVGNDGNDSSMQFESVSQIGLPANADERAKIREYVEEIVAEMLGGNLDHIKVGQLSKSENYLQLFDKFHAKLSNLLINVENGLCARALKGDLPAIVNGHHNGTGNGNNNNNNNNNGDSEMADISQTRLRSLIETIIAETLRSTSLSASGAVSEISLDTRSQLGAAELANGNGLKRRHRTEHYFEPKIYQDLLATAVLNKIADKEGNTRLLAESTPDLSGRHIDENFNAEALSTTSGSSIEPRSDSSLTDHEIILDNGKSQSLQADLERESVLSDYIAAHMVPLPDFSASVTESEDDIGSISSSMIGDGNWEDNWLFKKKRSSVTPSSTGMLVPAPKENIRAQIGDKTADEVSDLSEMGSDAEDSSLDLLRSTDLNDRLLSKHLIGGQNTKLVLDELVDRTSLTSHTLPEEHEPAFTETTNAFVVSPPAVPSVPPPPMIFQDDSLNEELTHTPIAAQAESEELSSLDGCTGFSTVEYIDEEQMHENVPSVIEILAAMALGPMLAVPASEQPGAMTPSEMHTLKELSDLALAEINARTMDLVHHHSLDIIEEETSDLADTAQFSSGASVGLPASVEEIAEPESVPSVDSQDASQADASPPPHILSDAVPETGTVEMDPTDLPPAATEDTIPPPETVAMVPLALVDPQFIHVEPPVSLEVISSIEPPASVEILPKPQPADVGPAATEDTIPKNEEVAAEPVHPVEVISEAQTIDPATPQEVLPDVEPPAPIEILSESQPADLEPSATEENIPQEEIVAVEPVAPVEVISETQTVDPATPLQVLPEVEPPAPAEILPESQPADVEPAAIEESIPQNEVVPVEPVAPVEVASETQVVDSATPLEVLPEVKPPAPAEILPESQPADVEPAAIEESIPQNEVVPVEPVAPVEVASETQTVDPAEPLEVLPNVEPPAPAEILPESQPADVEPSATEETIPQEEVTAVEPVAPVDVISETQTVDSATPLEVLPDVEPPAPAEILPESQPVDVEPSATEETIPQEEIVAVESVAPVEVTSETQTVDPEAPPEVLPDMEPLASAEILPESQPADVEPSAKEETIPQDELGAVEPVAPVDVISETQTVDSATPLQVLPEVEPPAPAEILPESQPADVEPAAIEETIPQNEVVPVEPVAPVEVTSETQTVDPAAPPEVLPEVEPPAPAEILPESQPADVKPSATEETIPQEEIVAVEPVAPVEVISETQTVDPATPLEVLPEVEPPDPAEILPESQPADVEPAAIEESIPQNEVVPVEPVASETQTVDPAAPPEVLPAVEPPAPAEILPDSPSATEETIPQEEVVAVEPVAPVDVISETQTVDSATPLEVLPDVEPPAPAEILPEPKPADVEPAAIDETISQNKVVPMEPLAPEEVTSETQTVDPAGPLEVLPTVEPPAPAEILPESQPADVEPAAIEESIPQNEVVPVEPVTPVEVASETQTVDSATPLEVPPDGEPPAPAEILPESQPADVEPSATGETIPQEEVGAVEPVAPVDVISETQTVDSATPLQVLPEVEPPAPAEILPESQPADVEPSATEETIPQNEVTAVEPVAPVEVTSETQAVDSATPLEVLPAVEPPAPAEILPESQPADVEPAAIEETIPQNEVTAVEPVAPVEVISETQTVDSVTPLEVPLDVVPPASAEILPESPSATEETIPQEEVVAVEPVAPVEVTSETQTVDPATPIEVLSDVEPPAPAEILPESQPADVKPSATEETIPQEEVVAVEPVAPVEVISETQTVDPATPLEVLPEVKPPAPAEILPESQPADVEPAAIEETIPQNEVTAVEPVAPEEYISKSQTVDPATPLEVLPDVEPPAPAKILPESQPAYVEPSATEETIPQEEVGAVEPVAAVEVSSEAQTGDPAEPIEVLPDVEPRAPVEILSEPEPTLVEPAAAKEVQAVSVAIDPVAIIGTVNLPTSKEILPETQSVDRQPSAPGEVVCKSQSIDEEPQLCNIVPEAQPTIVSEIPQQEEESFAEKTDPETQTIEADDKLPPSETPTNDPQITSTGEQLPDENRTEPVLERNSSTDSLMSDCSALGKTSQKCLRRQPNIHDTTPSDGNSPVKTESLNLLGTICKFYIKDKRLLATIERRRRRSLIMHKYLSSFDSMEDSIDDETHSSIYKELNEDSLAPSYDLQPPTERAATPNLETDPFETETDLIDNVRASVEEPQCLVGTENHPESHSSHHVESKAKVVKKPRIDKEELHNYISKDDKLQSHLNHLEDDVTEGDYSAATVRLDMASQTSCDMSFEPDVETDSLIVFSLSDITYNFINEILFSDQLSTESHYSDDSEPSTACETFNGDGDSEKEFLSQTVLVLDEHRSLNTNTNSNSTMPSNLHLPLTQTNNIPSGSRRTNGKLTNGSLKWSGGYTTELSIGGPVAAPQDGVAAEDDDVVLLRRFVPGSIAEREVKKWYNAVEMPNNPYAPEALKQRISGTQERYMDVPNISPSAEQKALATALTENTDPPSPQTDYKRYSRDYYINNAPKDSTGSVRAPGPSSFVDQQRSTAEDVEDIVINEVNQEPEPLPPHGRISSSAQSNAADLSHWTLSTPVRRSSSLKFINSRPSPRSSASTAPHSLAYERSATLERPSTSASHYRESGLGDDIDDDFDVRSQRSWRSSYGSLPKRHTQSSLSLHSNGSGMSFGSSVSKRRQAGGGPSPGVLTQFEKQLLHKDLKRNSFRAVSSTSKDFVMNPLFESEALGGKLALRPDTEDQGDSGVDSCLNGFSGADAKYSNNSLLF